MSIRRDHVGETVVDAQLSNCHQYDMVRPGLIAAENIGQGQVRDALILTRLSYRFRGTIANVIHPRGPGIHPIEVSCKQ
jgi:hypothetical protein